MKGFIELKNRFADHTNILVYSTQDLQPQAQMAAALIEKWGMVAASPDGEDSAGRAKMRLATPAEVVERACASAQLAMEEFAKRGWLLQIPAITEIPEPAPEPKKEP